MELKEEWRAESHDKDSAWSLTPYFCDIWGKFCCALWWKPVPRIQGGEWKTECEVTLMLWSPSNLFSFSSPKENCFILPVMKGSVSPLVIPQRLVLALWPILPSLLPLRWSQITSCFHFLSSCKSNPGFGRTLWELLALSSWFIN